MVKGEFRALCDKENIANRGLLWYNTTDFRCVYETCTRNLIEFFGGKAYEAHQDIKDQKA